MIKWVIVESLNWRWHGKGTDFVGFRFNNGSGKQYDWKLRIRMDGPDSDFSFTVLDYAWADSGEPIKAGQTSSAASVVIPDQGFLGLLAIGASGVALWRRRNELYSLGGHCADGLSGRFTDRCGGCEFAFVAFRGKEGLRPARSVAKSVSTWR